MATITSEYLGDLRVSTKHHESGVTIITDAPVDNQGKGASFSPTDLCATALGTCAMTILGIYAQKHDLDIVGATMEISKTMAANPRRISEIKVIIKMPANNFTEKDKKGMTNVMRACPVHKSLHADLNQIIEIEW